MQYIPTGVDFYNGHAQHLTPMDLNTPQIQGIPKRAIRIKTPVTTINDIPPPEQMPSATLRDHTKRFLPCKADSKDPVIRRPRIDMRNPCTLATGLARHQPPGLQSLHDYPTTIPLMPHEDTFYPWLNSTIPVPV